MKLIRTLLNLKPKHKGCIASIGNFDGVHLGHQHVFTKLKEKADDLKLPTTLITFEPQPQEYFLKDKAPARLTRFREKITALRLLKSKQIDQILLLSFNQKLAQMSAQDFIEKILINGLDVKYLVVGDDFKFGNNRQGDFAMLTEFGKKHGFKVVNMQSCTHNNKRISSTIIRQALTAGNLKLAKEMLGRNYRICGRVAHGHKRGRTIGFPTANIYLHRMVTPLTGVFVIELFFKPGSKFAKDGTKFYGVANLGSRPTVNGNKLVLEVFLFDFDAIIYGSHVSVDFLYKIRPEQKFASLDLLKQQITKDIQQAKQYLKE